MVLGTGCHSLTWVHGSSLMSLVVVLCEVGEQFRCWLLFADVGAWILVDVC